MEMPQIFENKEFGAVRTFRDKAGEPLFVAKDVALALGYEWNGNARIAHIPAEWRGVTSVVTPSGTQEMVVLIEQGLYFFLGRSDKPKALPFQKWLTGEVLPAIRKTGGYMITKADDTPEEIMARALLVAQDTMKRKEERIRLLEEKNLILEEQHKESVPKLEYHDKVLMSADTYTTNQIAKELGLSAITLNKKLKSLGVQYRQSGQWLLYAKYQNKGYTKTHTYTFTHVTTGQPGTKMRTVWTEKGRKFIHELLGKPVLVDN